MSEFPSVKVGDVGLLFRELKKPELGQDGYIGSDPSVEILPVGHRRTQTSKTFEVETVWEKDIEVPLRDGTILRGDIFRPASSGLIPAIIPWSPYGKTGRGMILDLSLL